LYSSAISVESPIIFLKILFFARDCHRSSLPRAINTALVALLEYGCNTGIHSDFWNFPGIFRIATNSCRWAGPLLRYFCENPLLWWSLVLLTKNIYCQVILFQRGT